MSLDPAREPKKRVGGQNEDAPDSDQSGLAVEPQTATVSLQVTTSNPSDEILLVWGRKVGSVTLTGPSAGLRARSLREAGAEFQIVADLQQSRIASSDRFAHAAPESLSHADVVVSPSQILEAGDIRSVRRQLSLGNRWLDRLGRPPGDGARLGVMLESQWLDPEWTSALVDALGQDESPIAVSFVDRNDPVGSRSAVQGLRSLASSLTHIGILRTDLAGIGALAHGAEFAAIGMTSTLRHVAPPGAAFGGSRNTRDLSPSLLHPSTLSWVRGSKLWRARGPMEFFECSLPFCDGIDLRKFRDPSRREEAYLHSVEVWLTLADRVFATAQWERPREWAVMCVEAHTENERFSRETGVALSPSPMAAWTAIGASS